MVSIGASTECGKDYQNAGRDHQRPFPGIMITQPAEEQLPNDSAREGERGNVLLSGGVLVAVSID